MTRRPVGNGRRAYAERVYALVRRIPRGHVMTYGRIASLLAPPEDIDPIAYRRIRARWVGYAMTAAPDDIPWQRVVNASGGISPRPGFGRAIQRARLVEEGIVFSPEGRLDLARYEWVPKT